MKTRILLSVAWLIPGIGLPAGRAHAGGARWSWQEPHAEVKATGDLVWKPEPFRFEAGPSVRYIDYGGGDDGNDGTSRRSPWKHHPWDPNATGKAAACKGVHTYVFKRGVVYRGVLKAAESGRPGDPIRLTSDPSWRSQVHDVVPTTWGKGEAVICGSETVRGWGKGADHKDIPEPGKVWYTDLDFAPRNVWLVGRRGKVTRIPLARTPNWNVSDPDDVKVEWWHWDHKGGKRFDNYTKDSRGRKLNLGIDTKHITKSEDYYKGALVWSEYGWVMGTPYPTFVEVVDLKKKGLGFGGQWGGVGGYKIVRYCRYFLGDKPHYLDDPDGEFWFDKKGGGGRLYIRLPGGADPNAAHIEAGRHVNLIDSTRMSHVHFTGLVFRFTNVSWDLTATAYAGRVLSLRKEAHPACIRLFGTGRDIRVSNCLFEHVYMPVRLKALNEGDVIDRVVVSDNEVNYTDGGGFAIEEGALWGHVLPRKGLLYDVKVLRNKLYKIGMRPSRYGQGVAIDVYNAQTAEIAGNMLHRCWGLGINMVGAKKGDAVRDVPLSRVIAHHNKVVDPLLNNNDFGGIETWQGGPFYIYNNIVGNPGGYQHWKFVIHGKEGNGCRFGHAYYLDGAFKNYHFNNIAWGKSSDRFSRLGNTAAVQEIHSYQNTFFNNTFYNFLKGTRRQAPQAGRNKFLGNIWHSISDWVFWHTRPAKTPKDGNEADAGPQKAHYALETNAFSRNIFHNIAGKYGSFEPSGRWHQTFDSMRNALEEKKAMISSLGEVTNASPLKDPANHDFSLRRGSAAIDKGVKVFVPWSLYAMVGEWNFYPAGDDPTRIMDEHWYMAPYYYTRGDYHNKPMFPLTGVNIGADDYVEGPLEDWTNGALTFNGEDQYAVCPNDKLNRSFKYTIKFKWEKGGQKETRTVEGKDFRSAQVYDSNFLLEAYFKTERGHTRGVLLEKMSGNGYSLTVDARGRVAFKVKGAGGSGAVTSRAKVDDGRWHHVIAEADRQSRTLTLYVDGKKDATGSGVGAGVSLANNGDLYVGGTPQGRHFEGAFDFLRIALGTLADAKTTIEELYAWQFDGPFLRDFAGRRPAGARRDAGAIEKVD